MKDRISELTVVLIVCLAPWAYGAVEAWAELWLYAGIALLTIFNYPDRARAHSRGLLVRLPDLALLGLVVLALIQMVPLEREVLSRIAPSLSVERARLVPLRAERVLGDANATVGLPAATLSLEPDATLQTAARLSAAWLLFQAVAGLRSVPGFSTRLARAVVFNAALLAVFAIVQGLTWNGHIYWVRPAHASMNSWSVGGPFLSHSHLAAYLNMGLGLALGLLMQGDARTILSRVSRNPWTSYAATIIAVGVIGSHSRSGFVGLLAASFLVACYLRRKLMSLGFGLLVVLAMIGLGLALLGSYSPFGSRLATILDFGNEGYSTRLEIWKGALRAWWARPIWGSGFGVLPVAISPSLEHSHWVFFDRAENEYVDTLAEGGVVGLLLVLGFLGGVGAIARRVTRDLTSASERGPIGGAIFGLIALSVQSFADFAPHVPAVGVLAAVLCGTIARQGRAVGTGQNEHAAATRWRSVIDPARWFSARLTWLGSVVVSCLLVSHAVRDAWIENRLELAGLPMPGTYMPSVGTVEMATGLYQSHEVARVGIQTNVGTSEAPTRGLDEYRRALEDVLKRRPNWSEGHVRLGIVHLALYRQMTKEWRDDSGFSVNDVKGMAEPLLLLGRAYKQTEETNDSPAKPDFLSFKPLLRHGTPAAHSFLEARRCSPFLALPHAELAALQYLLASGNSASTYATRALILSGSDGQLLTYLAQIGVQIGDRQLAARCWQKSLKTNPSRWPEVADAARKFLSSDEILRDVATDGGDAIRFADRLYPAAHQRPIRNRFLEVAIERFATRRPMITAEQLFLEAHALASLNQPERARKEMESALAMEPAQAAWREEYIEWLLHWGRADEAYAQALSGRYFSPQSKAIRDAVDRTARVLASGGTLP